MALLTLKDVGKIYVSEGNVAVGIRGVNLSFERGEFVAVTGKSGSGKSTLLNVVSGIDSYEEGELFVEGEPTSHYLQPEWEEYREKYISFIFQDYNIIESFTVLQNVELALLHIENKKERRAKAMELITRVGLASHAGQKGSRLSGGQKQRTVIARALAKDSPIILADEPTGNLDSATSKEIVTLLREVSRDKLLIMVTHNFEEVKEVATRHVRIFDGAVESDTRLAPLQRSLATEPAPKKEERTSHQARRLLKNGFLLGRSVFFAKPRLSLFLCILLLLGTFGVFMITALCGDASVIFEPQYMFRHLPGRVVIAKQSGEVPQEAEVKALAEQYGAKEYLRFDSLLDMESEQYLTLPTGDAYADYQRPRVAMTYGKHFGNDVIGRYPQAVNEVFLYLPISYRPSVGERELLVSEAFISGTAYRLVGVKYYYDNNLTPQCLFTEQGFRVATAVYYLNSSNCSFKLRAASEDGSVSKEFDLEQMRLSFSLDDGKLYAKHPDYQKLVNAGAIHTVRIDAQVVYRNYNYTYGDEAKTSTFEASFTEEDISSRLPIISEEQKELYDPQMCLYLSDELIVEIAEAVLGNSYRQASLFFENDEAAHAAAERLQEAGYIAVPSDTVYEPDAVSVILLVVSGVLTAILWALSIVFLAFFINLCSTRALGAFKGDMAIMRSMGIPVKVIRVGMHVRMLLSLIPGFVFVVLSAILIFTTPKFNEYFTYLYAWQYALIFVGMLLLTLRVTHKQIRNLFGESVKKSLKGGASE